MDAYNAKRQFGENLKLFGDPNTEPEKYNLYSGLLNLASGIDKIQKDIQKLQQDIAFILSSSR